MLYQPKDLLTNSHPADGGNSLLWPVRLRWVSSSRASVVQPRSNNNPTSFQRPRVLRIPFLSFRDFWVTTVCCNRVERRRRSTDTWLRELTGRSTTPL